MKHVPALDGLRAVAVLAVMLYHGGVSVVSGGFLGVDLFFVLSGFLITTLLLVEFEDTSRSDLKDFWSRRARRLLPALFLVLLAVLVYSAFLAGDAGANVRADVLATLFYASNWWFLASGTSYFDQFQDPSPLTHTWSLAIEEQWYLLLPVALVLLLPRLRSRRALVIVFSLLGVLSAVVMASLHNDASDTSRVYYGTDTRLQALLVGAALACLLTPGVMERVKPVARWGGPFAMLAVIALVVMASERSQWLYRGGFFLVALTTGLLLASVTARPDGIVARALSAGPLVWIGMISYGLYLWHWPVYVLFSPQRTGMSGGNLLVLRLIVTFGIAAASYYLVERPIRQGSLSRLPRGRRAGLVIAAPLTIIGLLGITAACARPAAPDSLEVIAQAASPQPTTSSTPGGDMRAVLVGDSVPLSLVAAFKTGDVPGLTVLPGTEFGCGLVPYETALNGNRLPMRAECQRWNQDRAQRIEDAGAELGVIFPGPWEQYDRWMGGPIDYQDAQWKQATVAAYESVLREVAAATSRQAVVLNTCHGAPEIDLPDAALYQAGRYPAVVNDTKRVDAVNDAMREAVVRSGIDDVTIIDPNPYLCDGGYRAQIDGVPLHTDGVHFTDEGADLYWRWLGPRLLEAAQ